MPWGPVNTPWVTPGEVCWKQPLAAALLVPHEPEHQLCAQPSLTRPLHLLGATELQCPFHWPIQSQGGLCKGPAGLRTRQLSAVFSYPTSTGQESVKNQIPGEPGMLEFFKANITQTSKEIR